MRKGLTEVVFILDRSGSMSGLEEDTIGGFNSMIKKQRESGNEVIVSTVLFDHESEVIHDRVNISRIEPLTDKEYWTRGSTALLDAVGGACNHIGNVHKYARSEDVPEKTIIVITTDGLENASQRYNYRNVKHIIERQQSRYGWEFVFMGANIDAAESAGRIGIRRERAVNYRHDSKGTDLVYESVANFIEEVQCCDGAAPASGSWREDIDRDFEERK